MADMRLLERTLAATVPLNRARRNFLAKFVVALLQVKTVNLAGARIREVEERAGSEESDKNLM